MYENPLYLPAGDRALVVELGDAISPEVNRRVHHLILAVERADLPGVVDLVPSYRSLLIYYDPLSVSLPEVQSSVEQIEAAMDESSFDKPRLVHIPALYGGKYGPDIEFVAEHTGLTVREVIDTHCGTDYLIYMIGFSPGFPYLGGLSTRLYTPRLETPRREIPAGSVGIAESQTGVYPVASPGGWRLIGRTPLRLFDPDRGESALLAAGDYVRFVPLSSEDEYLAIQQDFGRGKYEVAKEAVQ